MRIRADEVNRRQARVAHTVPTVGRQTPCGIGVAEQQPTKAELLRTGRAERVADQRFRGAARHVETEHARHDLALHLVVLRRGRAVQVDVPDVPGHRAGGGERRTDRGLGAAAARVRRRDVIAVRRLADAAQSNGARPPRDHEHARAFADVDPAPIGAERIAALGRKRLERVEAVQRQQAQAVDAADDRRVAETRGEQARGRGERLGRRRAGGRDRVAQAGQVEITRRELRSGADLLLPIVIAARHPALARECRGGLLACVDARRARAEHDGNARGPDRRLQLRDRRARPRRARAAATGCCGNRGLRELVRHRR